MLEKNALLRIYPDNVGAGRQTLTLLRYIGAARSIGPSTAGRSVKPSMRVNQ
jgi:hypothetical protein